MKHYVLLEYRGAKLAGVEVHNEIAPCRRKRSLNREELQLKQLIGMPTEDMPHYVIEIRHR
mgnify:CR=1 FL=1|tara:strand:+ start:10992 stop:11174 length:183 start_codon:yes stop_codon:yes gene_type:complete